MPDHAQSTRRDAARSPEPVAHAAAPRVANCLDVAPAVAALAATAAQLNAPVQRKASRTGLPDRLKAGVEGLSGLSLDDVRVHRNSAEPAQLHAHAFAQGTDIHLAPGQEQHLPHEAWHVVQQKQGRVKATTQLKGSVPINDDAGLEGEADRMGRIALARSAPPRSTRHSALSASSTSFASKPVQRSSMKSDDMTGALAPRTTRASTQYQTLGNPDSRTRLGSEARRLVERGARPPRRNLAQQPFTYAADGTELWTSRSRFAWNTFDDLYYHHHGNGVMTRGRMEYPCLTDHGVQNLPRERDLRNGETDFATIGHIVQWQEHILSSIDPEAFEVEGGTISAYSFANAFLAYCDTANLRLEGNVFNSRTSGRARRHDTLKQEWLSFADTRTASDQDDDDE
jgi:hypothetical protein